MSNFTEIITDSPITIPQIESKTFNQLWISHIRINSTPEKAMVIAHMVPYNGSETLKEPIQQITIDNIFEAMQDANRPIELRTLMMQTMELILQTIKAEMAYQNSIVPINVEE